MGNPNKLRCGQSWAKHLLLKDESAETIQKWSTLQANGSGSGEPIINDSDDIVQTAWKHAEVLKELASKLRYLLNVLMFKEEYIENDLEEVDNTICEYYGIEKTKITKKEEK